MEITIQLSDDNSSQGVLALKKYIDKAAIEGLEEVEIERSPHVNGHMGAGEPLNSIKALISETAEPLVGLVKCLQKYADNYRIRITIRTNNGDFILVHGKSMKADQLKSMVVAIQKNNN